MMRLPTSIGAIAKGKLGQYAAAIADFDTAIRLKPDDAAAYYNRGVVKGKLRQYIAAIADFDTAIRLKPDDAAAYYNRGYAKGKLGQYFAAIADSDTAIRHALWRTREAKRDFQTALKLAKAAGDAVLKAKIESMIRDLD